MLTPIRFDIGGPFPEKGMAAGTRSRAQQIVFDSRFLHLSTIRPLRALGRRPRGRAQGKARHAQKIPGRDDVLRGGMSPFNSPVSAFAETASGLGPAEDLFDAAPRPLAERMRPRAQVQAHQPAARIVAWMGRYPALPQANNELPRAIAAVRSNGARD
jgi:hypothetical protein